MQLWTFVKTDEANIWVWNILKARERFSLSAPRFLCNLSPFEWYHLFGRSYLNLTTYFHGSLLALKSCVPTISFDMSEIQGRYVSKIEQLFSDLDLSAFFNSYRRGIEVENVLDQIDSILQHHSEVELRIERNMQSESQKANSFLETLDRFV